MNYRSNIPQPTQYSGALPNSSLSIHNSQLGKQILFGALGVGALVGIGYLARHSVKQAVRNIQKGQAEKGSMDRGNPSLMAKQLHMAFENDNMFGWGTDEELVKQVFHQLPDQDFYKEVQRAYKQLYGKDLNSDLEDELDSAELAEVLGIYHSKPL